MQVRMQLSTAERDRCVEEAYAKIFDDTGIKIFEGVVVASAVYLSVETAELPGLKIRLNRRIKVDVDKKVTFGLGVKDRALWAHGVVVVSSTIDIARLIKISVITWKICKIY